MAKPDPNVFDPVKFSVEENQWLLEHLGEMWAVASRSIKPAVRPHSDPDSKKWDKNPIWYPDGVNPVAVKPTIDKVIELESVAAATDDKWVGVDALKATINTYLTETAKWNTDKRRGAPRFPSLYAYDEEGRYYFGGGGSDSGQVKTYFDRETGKRASFAIEFVPSNKRIWVADWAKKAGQVADKPSVGLVVNPEARRIECFCGHTENYKPDSRMSYTAARARISKHLRADTRKEFLDKHRQVHMAEFGTPRH